MWPNLFNQNFFYIEFKLLVLIKQGVCRVKEKKNTCHTFENSSN